MLQAQNVSWPMLRAPPLMPAPLVSRPPAHCKYGVNSPTANAGNSLLWALRGGTSSTRRLGCQLSGMEGVLLSPLRLREGEEWPRSHTAGKRKGCDLIPGLGDTLGSFL